MTLSFFQLLSYLTEYLHYYLHLVSNTTDSRETTNMLGVFEKSNLTLRRILLSKIGSIPSYEAGGVFAPENTNGRCTSEMEWML